MAVYCPHSFRQAVVRLELNYKKMCSDTFQDNLGSVDPCINLVFEFSLSIVFNLTAGCNMDIKPIKHWGEPI